MKQKQSFTEEERNLLTVYRMQHSKEALTE
jgi:hypothetical protein